MFDRKYHNSFDEDSDVFAPHIAPVRSTHNRSEISNISLNQSSLLPNSFDESSSISMLDSSATNNRKPSRTLGTGGLMGRNVNHQQSFPDRSNASDYIPSISMQRSSPSPFNDIAGVKSGGSKPHGDTHMSSILQDDSDSDWDKSPSPSRNNQKANSSPTTNAIINTKTTTAIQMVTMEVLQSLFSTSLISSNSFQFRTLKLSFSQDYADTR